MEYLQVILQFGTLLAIGVVALLLKSYVRGYAKQKGENLATKEDVEDITHRLERVKTSYAAQLEEIRDSLRNSSEQRRGFESERAANLLAFYDAAIDFYYEDMAITFGDFPLDDGESLFQHGKQFERHTGELMRKYQRIVLYFDHDDDLRVKAEAFLELVLSARKVHKSKFGRVKASLIEESVAHHSGDQDAFHECAKIADGYNRAYWNEMNPIGEELSKALVAYLTALNKHLRPKDPPSSVVSDLL